VRCSYRQESDRLGMELYQGPLPGFVKATRENSISVALADAYRDWYGRLPPEGQIRAWNNSLVRLKDVLEPSAPQDTGVLLEYELPLSSLRLDCMVTGTSPVGQQAAEVIELKQWESCSSTEEDSLVVTWIGGRNKPTLHPSAQVARYQQFLLDGHAAFYGESPVTLSSCAYLHNYRPKKGDPLLDRKFEELLSRFPVYLAPDYEQLGGRIRDRIGHGGGLSTLRRVLTSKLAPSKQFLRHVGQVQGNPVVHPTR